MFADCVDDVSVKAYTERGGKLSDLDEKTREALGDFLNTNGLSASAPYWRDMYGTMYISSGRLPCEQPYQRLAVTCDGRVGMCCYDWGIGYPVGYVDAEAYEEGDREYEVVLEKARCGARGFEQLANVKMPERYIQPPKKVSTLSEIWHGDLINDVRQKHVEENLEHVPVCRQCPFKETYHWVKVDL